MSIQQTPDGLVTELADGWVTRLFVGAGLLLLVGTGTILQSIALYAEYNSAQTRLDIQERYPPVPAPAAADGNVDCSLTPFDSWCDDARPELVQWLPTPTQLYLSRMGDPEQVEYRLAHGPPDLPEELTKRIGYTGRAVLLTYAAERDWSRAFPEGRDDWGMPDPVMATQRAEAARQVSALQDAFWLRQELHLIWSTVFELGEHRWQILHAPGQYKHRDDHLMRADHVDQGIVNRARASRDALTIGMEQPLLSSAAAAILLLLALLMAMQAVHRRRTPIVIRIGHRGLELDGQTLARHDILAVMLHEDRVVAITHDGRRVRSRVLADPGKSETIVGAAQSLCTTWLEHQEAEIDKAELAAQAAYMRERT